MGAYYWGVIGALIGFGIGYVIMSISYFFYVRKNMVSRNISRSLKVFNKNDVELLYKFSLPAALSSLLIGPVFWIARTMLANSPNGYGELGIYEVADQWKIIILFIPSSISNILIPILSSIYSQGKSESYNKTLKYNIIINTSITFILATLVALFAKWIMCLYGSEFDDIWTLIIVIYSTVFTSIASVIGIAITSKGKMWVGLGFNLLWSLIFLCFVSLFLKMELGAKGLALALLLSYLFHSINQYIYLKKTI